MPVFAFTVGSLGDILALLGLARRLTSTLCSLSTQTGGLGEVLQDVELFTRAINQVKEGLDRRHIGMHEDVVLGIRHHLRICYSILLIVDGKVSAFNAKISGQGGLRMEVLRKYWAVAAWEILGGREEVNALRARLRDQVTAIQTYLALSQSQDQRSVLDEARSQHVSADRIFSAVQDLQRCFGQAGVPIFQFQHGDTSPCYPPCARTSVQHLLHLFGELAIYNPSGNRVWPVTSIKDAYDLIGILMNGDHGAELIKGVAGKDLGFPMVQPCVNCCFYRGGFGCIEVLVGIPPPTAEDDTTASLLVCRDLIMAGHLDAMHLLNDRASYALIRERGMYIDRLQSTYQELWDKFDDIHEKLQIDDTLNDYSRLAGILFGIPDPASVEETVLPKARYFANLDRSIITCANMKEILDLVDCCPRLDWTKVYALQLCKAQTWRSDSGRMLTTFLGNAATLFRASARVPGFWDDL